MLADYNSAKLRRLKNFRACVLGSAVDLAQQYKISVVIYIL